MTVDKAIERLKTDIYKYADFKENPNENEFWIAFDMAVKALEQQCEDAISRQAAVTLASGYCHPSNIAKELMRLPSVQPKQIECEDAVSRQEVLGKKELVELEDGQSFYCISPESVESLPPVHPMPKMGHWIKIGNNQPMSCDDLYTCSECRKGRYIDPKGINFCENCGADMREPQESEVQDADSN